MGRKYSFGQKNTDPSSCRSSILSFCVCWIMLVFLGWTVGIYAAYFIIFQQVCIKSQREEHLQGQMPYLCLQIFVEMSGYVHGQQRIKPHLWSPWNISISFLAGFPFFVLHFLLFSCILLLLHEHLLISQIIFKYMNSC